MTLTHEGLVEIVARAMKDSRTNACSWHEGARFCLTSEILAAISQHGQAVVPRLPPETVMQKASDEDLDVLDAVEAYTLMVRAADISQPKKGT